jgi:hypothetical protein
MKRPSLLAALLLVASVTAAPILYAQQLQEGNWTGTATPPDGMTVDITYEVEYTDEGLQITIQIPEMGMILPANEAKLEGDKLTFGLSVETDELSCALEKQESGSFEGECVDAAGGSGYLVMTPPEGTAD